jgi:hypothetical protein
MAGLARSTHRPGREQVHCEPSIGSGTMAVARLGSSRNGRIEWPERAQAPCGDRVNVARAQGSSSMKPHSTRGPSAGKPRPDRRDGPAPVARAAARGAQRCWVCRTGRARAGCYRANGPPCSNARW